MWKKILLALPFVLLLVIGAYYAAVGLSLQTDNNCKDGSCPFGFVCHNEEICVNPAELLVKNISINPNAKKSSTSSDDSSINCVVSNCHGLDIECGENPPQACTEEYVMGDFCRQFAECEAKNGKCQQKSNSDFRKCKRCVDQCLDSKCEEDCREQFE